MFGLHPLDLTVIVVYLVVIVGVGIWVSRRVKDTAHYFLGGRAFGKVLMVGQSFSVGTNIGQPVAVAGKSFAGGLAGIWYQWKFIFGTPFYWMVAPIFRRLRCVTTAEYMEDRFGRGMGLLYTVFALVFFMMYQAAMLNGAAKVISRATAGPDIPEGIPRGAVIVGMTVIFVLYSFIGGMVSTVVTDLIQGLLITVFYVLLVALGLGAVGGFAGLRASLSPDRFTLSTPGNITPGLIGILSVQSIFSIFAQPHHMASVGTGRTEANCRVGFTYGNLVKRFVTILWALIGLIVAALVAQGVVKAPAGDDEAAFGLACRHLLGTGLVGLMVACILAANMSACSTFMVDMGALFVQNIYRRYIRPGEADRHYLWVGRWSGTAITLAAVTLAFWLSDVLSMILHADSLAAFMAVPFIAGFLLRRANAAGAVASFVIAAALYAGLDRGWYPEARFQVWHADVFCWAMGAAIAALAVVSLLTRPGPEEAWDSIQERVHLPTSAENAPAADRAARAREAEEGGDGLMLVDLFRLHRTFSFRRYRRDLLGFAAAWGVVAFLILCALAVRWL